MKIEQIAKRIAERWHPFDDGQKPKLEALIVDELGPMRAELETEQLLVRGLEGNLKACESENVLLREVVTALNLWQKERDEKGYAMRDTHEVGVIAALAALDKAGISLDTQSQDREADERILRQRDAR